MTDRNAPDLHEEINRRIRLQPHRIAAAAREGEIPEYSDQLAKVLEAIRQSYSDTRVSEEARKTPGIYKNPVPPKPGDEYYDVWGKDGGWSAGTWDELFPPAKGQPPHEALRLVQDQLKEFWTELRCQMNKAAAQPFSQHRNTQGRDTKRASKPKRLLKWAPRFAKEYVQTHTSDGRQQGNIREEMRPQNPSAKLFLAAAKLFDPSYTGSNCYSVMERLKNDRRSPEGQAALRERRKRAGQRHRRKKSLNAKSHS
ncbi:hypothetical protein HAP41_0000004550 [Bradyrhizobium barranii subsp. apii]|uniref:Uncharacterized protein n=1 Tax=Bradyrhizobium barranii subsp. apii TaxID=2819348 RepID=A0A8T5VIC0_9BRAD|nr:hypothetical protein [Bradyrhizobium barranii]UPT88410.1 hypothetical protein HAP41_0000004550 [Bradyrhizobium barranii subsp. apii]